jgi:hypothetical protein
MSEDKYTISKRTGRLKKRIRYKKKKKKNFAKIVLKFVKHPLVVLLLILLMASVVYFSINESGQGSGRTPASNAVPINKDLEEKKGI